MHTAFEQSFSNLPTWMKKICVQQCAPLTLKEIVTKLISVKRLYNLTYKKHIPLSGSPLEDIMRDIPHAIQKLAQFSSAKTKRAAHIRDVAKTTNIHRFSRKDILRYIGLFINKNGTIKSQLVPKELSAFSEFLNEEAERVYACVMQWKALEENKVSIAVSTLAQDVLHAYETLKNRQKRADYHNMIEVAEELLSKEDVRLHCAENIQHLLVDEAQDTSVAQWKVILSLVGALCEQWEEKSVFVVGDHQQSIYSFQGVRTSITKDVQESLIACIPNMDIIMMDHCYRCTQGVLEVVNKVGSNDDLQWLPHVGVRKQKGHIDLHFLEKGSTPEERASAIAHKIANFLSQGYLLDNQLHVQPSDIMILSRQRDETFRLLPQTLAAQGILCAGVDTARALTHPLIQSILLLMDFCILPSDDTICASILRSPWMQWDQQKLQDRLFKKPADISLWEWLKTTYPQDQETLFFEALLLWGREGISSFVRWVFSYKHNIIHGWFGALGKDGFLQLCQEYELAYNAHMEGFSTWLRHNNPLIKNTQNHGVRLMSVHGAKGLESPVVFLIDADRAYKNERERWTVSENGCVTVASEGPFWETERFNHTNHHAELNRLLYVALTRAEDALIIIGEEETEETWIKRIQECGASLPSFSQSPSTWEQAQWKEQPAINLILPKIISRGEAPLEDRVVQKGRLYHTLLLMALSQNATPEKVLYWANHIAPKPIRNEVVELIKLCLQSEAFAYLARYKERYLEHTSEALIDGEWISGRCDFIGIQDEKVCVVDFKTSAEQKTLPQHIQNQLTRYQLIQKHFHADKTVKTGIFYVQSYTLVWVQS